MALVIHSRNAQRILERGPCQHLGEVTREVSCNTCGNRTRKSPVNYCEKHGVECSRFKISRQPTIRHCLTCADGPWADLL